jgi:hypothetical protein
MPLFSYRAIDNDNKEVRGSIEAPDVESAKTALEDIHVEVVEVTEATRIKPPTKTDPEAPGQPAAFAFEGKDETGAVHRGTVQAPSKFDAFQRLRDDQGLSVSMLSPVGVMPQFRDTDLEKWQAKKEEVASVSVKPVKLAFTASDTSALASAEKKMEQTTTTSTSTKSYLPITSTLGLYAGWLLAWYGFFVAFGYYATVRTLPWDIPFVRAFYVSPLIFSFTVAIFLFLLLSKIHRMMQGRLIAGIFLAIVGVVVFFAVRLSL